MRPLFLQRLSGRVARQVVGVEREPVAHTERDLALADLFLSFTADVCSMGVAIMFFITYFWRPTCF
ncbi:hypothetical protein [Paraburkholderia saeva]|uniref:Uncharacterized protein n=1 Tax=Paraburkholderia saeva TaxID=2777537 RepID=A0A9N8RX20_9BURK|nr:hypothetical protein [Paraburkholderia saeva]CAG4900555.1 hypothetical protein LMG31841_02891 [Paraburkholderia saeva]